MREAVALRVRLVESSRLVRWLRESGIISPFWRLVFWYIQNVFLGYLFKFVLFMDGNYFRGVESV